MRAVSAVAPCRVDLAGGTLDLWPLGQLVADAVTVNLAVDVMVSCRLTVGGSAWTFAAGDAAAPVVIQALGRRPEREVPPEVALPAVIVGHLELPPCRVEWTSQAPRGSGLGGSSALAIALLAAGLRLRGETPSEAALVALACNLETRVLGLPAGTQDHWAAVRGGLNVLEHRAEGVRVTSKPAAAMALARELLVADTGVQHHSGLNNWSVFRRFMEGDAGTRAALSDVAAAAQSLRAGLDSPDEADVLAIAREALRDEWSARRRLSAAVTCPEVDAVIQAAEQSGGAGKVCGAGGGGCVACLPGPGGRGALESAVWATGARILTLGLQGVGVRTSDES